MRSITTLGAVVVGVVISGCVLGSAVNGAGGGRGGGGDRGSGGGGGAAKPVTAWMHPSEIQIVEGRLYANLEIAHAVETTPIEIRVTGPGAPEDVVTVPGSGTFVSCRGLMLDNRDDTASRDDECSWPSAGLTAGDYA